ncbi:hypothetical protein J6590_092532 [Homalodisca vitripennis]|nr:hypothetical protein J6590_092532 [Homalodisca vitripennis]
MIRVLTSRQPIMIEGKCQADHLSSSEFLARQQRVLTSYYQTMAEGNFHPDHLSASEFLARDSYNEEKRRKRFQYYYGARFLDGVSPARTSSEPRPCCEVLIADTNDLAVGEQRNIYRHLEGYIAAGASNKVIILTTLPHRHDLNLTHPVHYQTVLVNAYIEELAARHNLRVLNFDDIGRRYFTRHGQHLSWRGKRLLVDMIVAAMGPATQGPGMTAQPRFQGNHRTTASNTANLTSPAAARGESATTRQRAASVQDISYADAVRRSPRPDILQIKGCSANLKENSVFYGAHFTAKD